MCRIGRESCGGGLAGLSNCSQTIVTVPNQYSTSERGDGKNLLKSAVPLKKCTGLTSSFREITAEIDGAGFPAGRLGVLKNAVFRRPATLRPLGPSEAARD